MACGDPDEPECTAVLHDVWLFLDDELDPERRAKVQHHLDECSPCLAEAGLDEKLKALLHAKCGGEHAPEHLRARVTGMLNVSMATVSMSIVASGGSVVQRTSMTSVELRAEADPPGGGQPTIGGQGQ